MSERKEKKGDEDAPVKKIGDGDVDVERGRGRSTLVLGGRCRRRKKNEVVKKKKKKKKSKNKTGMKVGKKDAIDREKTNLVSRISGNQGNQK